MIESGSKYVKICKRVGLYRNSRVTHDVLFEEWERQLGVCMGVLGKSRQGCVGVINNIGALTNLLTSLVLPNPSAYMYIVYSLM